MKSYLEFSPIKDVG